jgi:predicted permease
MSWLHVLVSRIRGIFSKRRLEREFDDELRSHIEMLAEENMRKGMSPEEARYAARRAFGGVQQTKEVYRERRGFAMVETFVQDVRYGLRMLRRSPAFTAAAVFTLALGIGANTTIFTIVDGVMLKMLPVKNPSELVQLSRYYHGQRGSFSYPWYEQFRDQSHVFSGVFAVAGNDPFKLRIGQDTEPADSQYVSGNYYTVLGVNAFAGRIITPQDDKITGPLAEPVAVLSYGFWKGRFGADPSVIGRTVFLEDVPFTIVGVTPPEFFGVETGRAPSITVPLATERRIRPESWLPKTDYNWLSIMARLKPGVSSEQARADLGVIFHGLVAKQAGEINDLHSRRMALEQKLEVSSAGAGLDTLRLKFSDPLHILMAVVGLVLLIACANIANLLLARAAARRREIAVRLALGAGRSRLLRQFLTESMLLSAIGGALGLLFAWWGSNGLVLFMSNGAARILPALTPDARVLAFTVAVSLLTGVFFGLAPAFRATCVDAGPALKETRAMSTSSKLGAILVISQAGLSLVLLMGAILFARSLRNLETMNAGFDRNNVLMLDVDAEGAGYKTGRLTDYYRQLLARIAEIPGVHSASGALITPISGSGISNPVQVEGYTPRPEEDKEAYMNRVAPKYFETLGTPLLAGRDFTLQDRKGTPTVAIINQTMARYYFRNSSPIGRHVTMGHDPMEIVGVVGDAKYLSLRETTPRTVYLPCFQDDLPWVPAVFVRTSLPISAIATPLRRAVRDLDKSVAVAGIKTLSQQVEQSLIRERMIAMLSSFFGLLALLLASIGLYGVMSYSVVRRTNEIGIRAALGATRRDVVWLVLRETMLLVALGIAIGLPAAIASARLIRDQLFGLEPADPLTVCGATLAIVAVAALAGYLPARRAAQVDPMVALRYE